MHRSRTPRISTSRLLAGPGTGKTFGLQHRVARLLQDSVEPSEILAVTFTRAAANALKNDLKTVGVEGAQQIQARTPSLPLLFSVATPADDGANGQGSEALLEFELEPCWRTCQMRSRERTTRGSAENRGQSRLLSQHGRSYSMTSQAGRTLRTSASSTSNFLHG